MTSVLAGIIFILCAGVSIAVFAWRAAQKGKRPGVGSAIVALLIVPMVAGLLTAPLSAIGAHVPGFSLLSGLIFAPVMLALCAGGGYVLVSCLRSF